MKIGSFSRKSNVPISTIRYYISEDLLTPKKNGAQYDFDERNEHEMQLLNELRQMNFTMEEMKRFVNIIRMLNPRDELRYRQLQTIFDNKRKSIQTQIEHLQNNLTEIDLKAAQLKMEESVLVSGNSTISKSADTGIPTEFLHLLKCPVCGKNMSLNCAQIHGSEIISGNLICECGYEGIIENGIINIDPDIDLDKDKIFTDDYFGESSTGYQDYCIQYEGFLSAHSDFLNIQHKSREWIHDAISDSKITPKVILFPDIASLFLYLHTDAEYLKDALIIVMGLSRKGVEASRSHLRSLGSCLKIMYVIAPSNRLPVKSKSIDLIVDYLASFNYAFFYDKPLYEYIDKYCSDNAVIAGCTTYYAKGSKSVNNIETYYIRSMKPFITLTMILDTIKNHGYNLLSGAETGYCTDLTDYFDYHVSGEKNHVYTFFARR